MKAKHIIVGIVIAVTGGLIALFSYAIFFDKGSRIITARVETPVRYASLPGEYDESGFDFTVKRNIQEPNI
jgi:hypothetical protein